jgi:hypothetical protein
MGVTMFRENADFGSESGEGCGQAASGRRPSAQSLCSYCDKALDDRAVRAQSSCGTAVFIEGIGHLLSVIAEIRAPAWIAGALGTSSSW